MCKKLHTNKLLKVTRVKSYTSDIRFKTSVKNYTCLLKSFLQYKNPANDDNSKIMTYR